MTIDDYERICKAIEVDPRTFYAADAGWEQADDDGA